MLLMEFTWIQATAERGERRAFDNDAPVIHQRPRKDMTDKQCTCQIEKSHPRKNKLWTSRTYTNIISYSASSFIQAQSL